MEKLLRENEKMVDLDFEVIKSGGAHRYLLANCLLLNRPLHISVN